jgi:hypothetical protein
MEPLLMPSDAKAAAGPGGGTPAVDLAVGEPPSVKLIVRLFLIPLMIVAAAVGVMFLIGLLAGGTPSMEELVQRLRRPGGGRTANVLVGPGSKQRFLDAEALSDTIRAGMPAEQRISLSADLIDILDKNTTADEGNVRHFLLLALGRTWQKDSPGGGADDSAASRAAREATVDALMRYADSPQLADRKAAILAMGYLAGQEEVQKVIPVLIKRVTDEREDLDIRLAAATVLGPIATRDDQDVIAALNSAMRDTDPKNVELVWSAALSLAQLGESDVQDTILTLLDRDELATLKYYDRETDPQNPVYTTLSEKEQERILINTMAGARKLDTPAIRKRIAELAADDPSARVRYAAKEILQDRAAAGGG